MKTINIGGIDIKIRLSICDPFEKNIGINYFNIKLSVSFSQDGYEDFSITKLKDELDYFVYLVHDNEYDKKSIEKFLKLNNYMRDLSSYLDYPIRKINDDFIYLDIERLPIFKEIFDDMIKEESSEKISEYIEDQIKKLANDVLSFDLEMNHSKIYIKYQEIAGNLMIGQIL